MRVTGQPPRGEDELDEDGQDERAEQHGQDEPAWKRRRRLEAVFGDVLPDTTSDERDERGDTSEEWLRRQVPPHHG